MAVEYVPTTEQVRAVWAAWAEYGGLTDAPSGRTDDHLAEFDRWLAAHDRETKAEALREFAARQYSWCEAGRGEQIISREAMRDALIAEADRA